MYAFEKVLDQDLVKKVLSGALEKGKLAHAYLFYGVEGVGKWAMALELAKAVNCEDEKTKPCQKCTTCKKIFKLVYPDVNLIFPLPPLEGKSGSQRASEKQELIQKIKEAKISDPYDEVRFFKKTTISVDDIREMIRYLNLKPVEGRKKVVIIKEVENLSHGGANSILKVLEEPPGESLLILTARGVDRLLPTIISRCQLLKFSSVPSDIIQAELRERFKLSSKKASNVANISKGSLGKAIYLAQKKGEFAQKSAKKFLKLCYDDGLKETIDFVESVSKEYTKDEVLELLDGCILVFRDLYLFTQLGKEGKTLDEDLEKLKVFFDSLRQLELAIREAERTRRAIQQNVSVVLALLAFSFKLKYKTN
ncbi:MAG: hypothetical protein AMJ90_09400 [candidate division Zixibacteria bacterium SM23_73_2]|nr:MAG: hypothetical protein AMJ90_09400 [candidate division Zixibacteria bacterium SM23_73_2]